MCCGTVWGAPACNHMKYGCQMQNNLLNKDDVCLRKYLLLFLTQPEYLRNYFAFSASKGCAAQAPPFMRCFLVLYIIITLFLNIFCSVLFKLPLFI